MCIKNVVLFNCGHTRTLSYVCRYPNMECCPNTKRNLIPEEGGCGIEAPIQKNKWVCALKCQPGVPAHDPLLEKAKENVTAIKRDIEQRIKILSALMTPASTPGLTPGCDGGMSFDQRFAESISRRRPGLTPAYERPALQWQAPSFRNNEHYPMLPEARDDISFNFTNMKLKIPVDKFREKGIKEESEGNQDC